MEAGARLRGKAGTALAEGARHAFVRSAHVTLLAGAVLIALGAVAAPFTLRGVPAVISDPGAAAEAPEADGDGLSDRAAAPVPARH